MKVAVLGCGRVSARYREVLSKELNSRIEVTAVADLDLAKAQSMAQAVGGRPVQSIEDLVRTGPDLVFVMTESGNHAKHVLELLQNEINVIVEKPVALRISDAIKMRNLAKEKGLMCGVIKQNRYNPAMKFVKSQLEKNRLGRLVSAGVRVHWCRYQDYYDDPWHGRWASDGGVLAQQAIHHLDALQWLGGEIESVCAYGTQRFNKLEAEDTAVGIVRFKSGAVGTIEATTSARDRDYEAAVHLVGEKGLAKIAGQALNKLEQWHLLEMTEADEGACEAHSQDVPTSYGLGHGPLISDALDALERGDVHSPPINVDGAVTSLKLLHGLYRSMETGRWVDLSDDQESSKLGLETT